MRKEMISFNWRRILSCSLMVLTLGWVSTTYAVDKAELKDEVEKTYQELKNIDPEAAQEFVREYRDAVKNGEISVERADAEKVKEMGEKGATGGEERFSDAEQSKMKAEFDALAKEGKTPQEAEKIMREKYGEPERGNLPDFDLAKPEERTMALERLDKDSAFLKERGLNDDDLKAVKDAISRGDGDAADKIFDKMGPEFEGRGPSEFERGGPPEGMERFGPEGREMSKEDMVEHFREGMGREPTDQEKEMMEKGEFDRPDFDRPEFEERFKEEMGRETNEFEREMMERGEFDRPEFDRPEFERPEFERPEFEKPEFEREPPPPMPEPPPAP